MTTAAAANITENHITEEQACVTDHNSSAETREQQNHIDVWQDGPAAKCQQTEDNADNESVLKTTTTNNSTVTQCSLNITNTKALTAE